MARPMDLEDGPLLETGLPGCLYRFSEYGGQPFSDGNPAFGLQLHHPRFLEFVGAPESARLLDCSPTFWVDHLGKEQAMAAGCGHYVVQSSDSVTVRHVVTQDVIPNDGLGHMTVAVSADRGR